MNKAITQWLYFSLLASSKRNWYNFEIVQIRHISSWVAVVPVFYIVKDVHRVLQILRYNPLLLAVEREREQELRGLLKGSPQRSRDASFQSMYQACALPLVDMFSSACLWIHPCRGFFARILPVSYKLNVQGKSFKFTVRSTYIKICKSFKGNYGYFIRSIEVMSNIVVLKIFQIVWNMPLQLTLPFQKRCSSTSRTHLCSQPGAQARHFCYCSCLPSLQFVLAKDLSIFWPSLVLGFK